MKIKEQLTCGQEMSLTASLGFFFGILENLGEIPRKNTPSAIRTDTHDDLTSQEQRLRNNHAKTERARRLIDKI